MSISNKLSQLYKVERNIFNPPLDDHALKVFREMLSRETTVGTPITQLVNIYPDLEKIIKSIETWANSLGFDVIDRLPLISAITYIDKDVFRKNIPNARISNDTTASADLISNTIQVFKYDQTNVFRLLETISHELIHLCSYRTINVEISDTYIFSEGWRGYWSGTGSYFRNFNEAITELSNINIISEIWDEEGILENIPSPRKVSYEGYVILLIALMYETSIKNNLNIRGVFTEWESGLVSGDHKGLYKLLEVFDKTVLDSLFNEITTETDELFIEKYAHMLGLSHFLSYINKVKIDKREFRYIWDFIAEINLTKK